MPIASGIDNITRWPFLRNLRPRRPRLGRAPRPGPPLAFLIETGSLPSTAGPPGGRRGAAAERARGGREEPLGLELTQCSASGIKRGGAKKTGFLGVWVTCITERRGRPMNLHSTCSGQKP